MILELDELKNRLIHLLGPSWYSGYVFKNIGVGGLEEGRAVRCSSQNVSNKGG